MERDEKGVERNKSGEEKNRSRIAESAVTFCSHEGERFRVGLVYRESAQAYIELLFGSTTWDIPRVLIHEAIVHGHSGLLDVKILKLEIGGYLAITLSNGEEQATILMSTDAWSYFLRRTYLVQPQDVGDIDLWIKELLDDNWVGTCTEEEL